MEEVRSAERFLLASLAVLLASLLLAQVLLPTCAKPSVVLLSLERSGEALEVRYGLRGGGLGAHVHVVALALRSWPEVPEEFYVLYDDAWPQVARKLAVGLKFLLISEARLRGLNMSSGC